MTRARFGICREISRVASPQRIGYTSIEKNPFASFLRKKPHHCRNFRSKPRKSPSGVKMRKMKKKIRKIVPSDSITRCLRTLLRTKETRCSCMLSRLRITTSLVMEDLTISCAIFTRQRCTVYRCQGHGTTRTTAHSLSLFLFSLPFRSSAANVSFFEFKEA